MNTTPQASKIEKIPVRRPDGSFVMVEVGDGIDSKPEVEATPSAPPVITEVADTPIAEPVVNKPISLKPSTAEPPVKTSPPVVSSDQDSPINWEASVDKVINVLDVNLFDDSAKVRLRSVIMSRLRDVRDFLATKEVLTKSRTEGGLGLVEADAVKVLNNIDIEYNTIHAKQGNTSSEKGINLGVVEDPFDQQAKIDALVASEIPYSESNEYMDAIAQAINKTKTPDKSVKPVTKPKTIDSTITTQTPAKPLVEPKPVVLKSKPVGPVAGIKLKIDAEDKVSATPKPPPITPKEIKPEPKPFVLDKELKKAGADIKQNIIKPTAVSKPKPTMNDVVAEKRLMGPIDELRTMRLVDFRRLGNSTSERLQKVKNHIEELEDESFAKKVEAIAAWRSNPIYRMYVSIGSQGLMGTQTIADVIKEKQQKGEEILTQEEFEKLTDFNKKLKY